MLGHAFEARLYAENPAHDFLPGAGRVLRWRPPAGATSFAFPPSATAAQQQGPTLLAGGTAAAGGTSASGGRLAATAATAATTTPVAADAAADAATAGAGFVGMPPGCSVRVDAAIRESDEVGTNYDPMIAKVITHGPDRDAALAALHAALSQARYWGFRTTF